MRQRGQRTAPHQRGDDESGTAGGRGAAADRRRTPQPAARDPGMGGQAMTHPASPGRISRKELVARGAVGMRAYHPELVTRKPGRAEWKHLARWLTEMWPN